MCNIAGYVGKKAAAPILIDMLRREEGFDAGYYSGIATICDGKIHYAKLVGNVDRLCDCTDALSLPGNIGIIHGRSGTISGDYRWAHPFTTEVDGEVKIAYVANGGIGYAENRRAEYTELADSLMKEGFDLKSRQVSDTDLYNKLSDGSTAHMSDIMCQLISKHMREGVDTRAAMEKAFCDMPSEIVGLLLSLSDSDKIFFSRINQPMFLSFSEDGAYLSTTPHVFPDSCGEAQLLPPLSSGYITNTTLFSSPFKAPPCTVAPISARLRRNAYDLLCRELLEEEREVWDPVTGYDITACFLSEFESADCVPANAVMYDVLYSLYKEGRLNIRSVLTPTGTDDISATRFKLKLK